VANNPVKLVDPNGMDIWTISEDGTINRQKDKKIDRIDVVGKDGNTIKGTEAKFGTIKQHTFGEGKHKIDFFDIKGDDLAKESFENIADNTNIEWTHAKVGTEKSGLNIVGTSHDKESTFVGSFLLFTGYTLKEINHNHPSGVNLPSGNQWGSTKGDIPNAKRYEAKFPNIILNTYVNGNNPSYKKGYQQYNSSGAIFSNAVIIR
jgi:hypothetical protein